MNINKNILRRAVGSQIVPDVNRPDSFKTKLLYAQVFPNKTVDRLLLLRLHGVVLRHVVGRDEPFSIAAYGFGPPPFSTPGTTKWSATSLVPIARG